MGKAGVKPAAALALLLVVGLVGSPARADDAPVREAAAAGIVAEGEQRPVEDHGSQAEHDHGPGDSAQSGAAPRGLPNPDEPDPLPSIDVPSPVRPIGEASLTGKLVLVASGGSEHLIAPVLVTSDGRSYPLVGSGLEVISPGSVVAIEGTLYPRGSLSTVATAGGPDIAVTEVTVLSLAPVMTGAQGIRKVFVAALQWPAMPAGAIVGRNCSESGGSNDTISCSSVGMQNIGEWSRTASDGAFGWDVTVADLTLPDQPACDDRAWRQAAITAATAAGHDIVNGGFSALAILMPPGVTCISTAYAYGGVGEWNREWWSGFSVYSYRYSTEQVLIHELGHSLGLPHANNAFCVDSSLAVGMTYTGTCRHSEYGDPYDPMGTAFSSSMYNPVFSRTLGWTPAGDRVSLTPFSSGEGVGSQSITLTGYANIDGGVRVAEIELPPPVQGGLAGQSPGKVFLEYKHSVGIDAKLNAWWNSPGNKVYVRWSPACSYALVLNLVCGVSYLIDTVPSTESRIDAGLSPGETWTDPTSGLRLTFISRAADLSSATLSAAWIGSVEQPRNVQTTPVGEGGIKVTWERPSDPAPITGYEVTLTSSTSLGVPGLDSQTCSVPASTLECSFTGLRHNTPYTADVITNGVAAIARDSGKTWVSSTGSPVATAKAALGIPGAPELASISHHYVASPEKIGVRFRMNFPEQYIPNNLPDAYSTHCYPTTGVETGRIWMWVSKDPSVEHTLDSGTWRVNERYYCKIKSYRDSEWLGQLLITPSFTTSASPWQVPDAPQVPEATAGVGSATVSWAAPADNGTDILQYRATATSGGASCVSVTLRCEISGLVPGVEYRFSVTATSSAGTSVASPLSTTVTAIGVPGVPASVSGVRAGSGAVRVSWGAAAPNGSAVLSYAVSVSGGGGQGCATTVGVDADALSCVVSGLVDGTSYQFSVMATNEVGVGSGAVSSALVPATVPGAPTRLRLIRTGVKSIQVDWDAPGANGGMAITKYVVTSVAGGESCTALSPVTACIVKGLAKGRTYQFKVVALNQAGLQSVPSPPSVALAPGIRPGSARISDIRGSGSDSITVSWRPPTRHGGLPITGYVVRVLGLPKTCVSRESTDRSCVIFGLAKGVAYRFAVAARNDAGSMWSEWSRPFTMGS